jgi:hypothetical protein
MSETFGERDSSSLCFVEDVMNRSRLLGYITNFFREETKNEITHDTNPVAGREE